MIARVFAQPEFAYALAGLKESGGAEVGPINAALFQIPKHLDVSVDYGDPFLGKVPGLAQRDARVRQRGCPLRRLR